MPQIDLDDITVQYEMQGERGSPLVLLAGLGGVGRSWGAQIEMFARRHRVVAPDHRGTGGSTRAPAGYTIEQHARDLAALIERLELGPVHLVGISTGGTIAQVMALEHPGLLRTITLASTWARKDAFFERQMQGRMRALTGNGLRAAVELNSLFLFSPEFHRERPDAVAAWIEASSSGEYDQAIALARIEMVLRHDRLADLGAIALPVLIVTGRRDFCTPPYFSEEIASAIPHAERVSLDAGHFLYLERPGEFHREVDTFIGRNESAA